MDNSFVDVPKEALTLLENEVIGFRRHIHQYPEIGADQPATVDYVTAQFAGMDVDIRNGPKCAGCVVDIEGNDSRGSTIAFRADMDGLPIRESEDKNHFPNRHGFQSRNIGIMHACGHDAHTAILTGVGKLLYTNRDKFKGRIRLLFQPGEEGHGGAHRMVSEGCLENTSAVFALHCHPQLHLGQIGYRKGSMFAAVDTFNVKVTGPGGHGAQPETHSDQVLALCRTVSNLHAIVSRRISPREAAVVSICYIKAGREDAKAVMPELAEFGGTVRTLDPETRGCIADAFKSVCKNTVASIHPDCRADITYRNIVPETINDENVVSQLSSILANYLSDQDLITSYPPQMGSEDFSLMLNQVPGAMIMLGVTDPKRSAQDIKNLHSPDFDLDERALIHGVRLLATIAFNFKA